MRMVTLLVRYGVEQYAGATEKMETLLATLFPEWDRELVVIDNALLSCYEEVLRDGLKVIGGDNEHWEFSGWDRGIEYLGARVNDYDIVHLATSAYDTLYTSYVQRFSEDALAIAAASAVAIGHIDFYPYPVRMGAFISQHWMRTSFLCVSPAEIRALGSLVTFGDKKSLFGGDPAEPFRPEAQISAGYRSLIINWLTSSDGTGQGTSWHSRFELNSATLTRFEDKTMAILNEHALSVRLRAQGCKLVDISYLDGRFSDLEYSPGRKFPGWRQQLMQRKDDALEPGPIEPYR